jgi:hypothetical protein
MPDKPDTQARNLSSIFDDAFSESRASRVFRRESLKRAA